MRYRLRNAKHIYNRSDTVNKVMQFYFAISEFEGNTFHLRITLPSGRGESRRSIVVFSTLNNTGYIGS